MERTVEAEMLDELPAHNRHAIRSRRDLRRINAFMGNAGIIAGALQDAFSRHLAFRIVEIGAGDGELMLSVARRLRGKWRGVEVTLVDQQDLLQAETRAELAAMKWRVCTAQGEVFKWLRENSGGNPNAIVANLFLHHFNNADLRKLFLQVAGKARIFIAVEPRRSKPALICSWLLWLIGCNSVTRHDAAISVRAGFAGRELSALWPDIEKWELIERPAGHFSHLFIAQRKEPFTGTVFQPALSLMFNRQTSTPAQIPDDPPSAGVATGNTAEALSVLPRKS
jgi:hypothetical protein